jgi:hypothetical protein
LFFRKQESFKSHYLLFNQVMMKTNTKRFSQKAKSALSLGLMATVAFGGMMTPGQDAQARLIFTTESEGVNSEQYHLDNDDSSAQYVDLAFGSGLSATLRYDKLSTTFFFNKALSLLGNELKNFRVENQDNAGAPTCESAATGRMYYNTDNNKLLFCDGTNWVDSASLDAGSVTTTEILDGTIQTVDLADGIITTAKLGADAVTNAKLADDAVQTENIVDGTIATADLADSAITTVKLGADAVTNAKLADDAIQTENIKDLNVTTAKLAADAITNAKLADNAVQTENIADLNVTTGKIAADAITNAKLADDAVQTENIKDLNVTTAKLAADAITNAKLADNAVQTENIADLNVTTGKIAADAITNAKVADDAIQTENILDGTIATADLADSAITTAKIEDLNVTTGKIAADAITNAKVADDAIQTENILDGTIATADLADSAITSSKISDGTITLADVATRNATTAFNPEYPNFTISADGTNNVGTLESDLDTSVTPERTYYKWSSQKTTLQDYDIIVQWAIPENFQGFTTSGDQLSLDLKTTTTAAQDNVIDVTFFDTTGTEVTLTGGSGLKGAAGDTWETAGIQFSGGTFTPGQYVTLKIKMSAKDGNAATIGTLKFLHTVK